MRKCLECGLPTFRDPRARFCWDCAHDRLLERNRRRNRKYLCNRRLVPLAFHEILPDYDVDISAYPSIWAAKSDMPNRLMREAQR